MSSSIGADPLERFEKTLDHLAVTCQPASRYWDFHWFEMAIFLGLAIALVGFCVWWVRPRLT